MRKRIIAMVLMLTLCVTLIPSQGVRAAKNENTYVVARGDSLYRIGKDLDLDWVEIGKINKIKAPFALNIGDKLLLPKTEVQKAADEKTAKEKAAKEKAAEEKAAKEKAAKEKAAKEKAAKDKAAKEKAAKEKAAKEKAAKEKAAEEKAAEEKAAQEVKEIYSAWALNDLLIGDSYGIYPLTWYEKSLINPISKEQLKVLVTGLSDKILIADGVTKKSNLTYELKDNMTVEEVLGVFYAVLSSNEYSKDMGLNKRYSISAYMNEYGVFTGAKGELELSDICTIEQACVFATRIITYVYDTLDSASKGFLWEVKKGNNTVYLLGSIHIANNSIYPFSKRMLEAYQSSDALVVEANLYDTAGTNELAALAVYSDGTTLKNYVSNEVYTKTVEIATVLGMSEESIAIFKPWFISNLFSTLLASGSDSVTEAAKASALGIDMSFLTNAVVNGKTILEIEGIIKQGKMFDDFSDGLQEYLLKSSIEALNNASSEKSEDKATNTVLTDQWLNFWHDGNIEAFKDSYNVKEEVLGDTFQTTQDPSMKALTEEYYNTLLTRRDKGMADYIDNLLKEDGTHTYFVVVGALHYLSDYSVIDILKERGYVISQIK